ncbi:hypothetical protein Tco_0631479 [Tanacetum coccineum]
MPYSEQTHLVNYPENEITSDSNIIPYSHYLLETQNTTVQDINFSTQQEAMILSVFEQLLNRVTNCNKVNKDNLIANESLSAELEIYKERVKLLEERQNVDLNTQENLIMDDIIQEKNAQFMNFEKEYNYLKQTLSEQSKEKEVLTKIFNVFKNESKEKEAKNIDKEIALEKKVKELDNIVSIGFQNPFYLKKAQQIRPMLYDGSVIAKETNLISIVDSEETLMFEEESRSKMLLKQKLSNEQAFRLQTSHPNSDQSASSPVKIEAPQELPKYHVDKQCFEIQKKQFLIENDRLLDQIISEDIVNIVVNSSLDINTSVNVNSSVAMNDSVNYVEMCNKCLEVEAELIKQHNIVEKYEYNRLSKSSSKLEQHCISLELAMQLNKQIFQKNNTSVNQTEPSFDQLFELNNLKAELQVKDITIKKLKANIKRLNKASTTNSVKKDIDEIDTINIELEHMVIKLIAENEHLKQTYKQLCVSIKPSRVRAKEHAKSLVNQLNQKSVEITDLNAQLQEKFFVITALNNDLRKFKGKYMVDNAAQVLNDTTIGPGMYKLDLVTLAPKDKNNKETHTYYLNFMFDVRHELCFLEFISDINASSKSKSIKKAKKKEEWKPTGKVFTTIGYNWRPTERTFTLVGNACPLTRITATNKVPLREPIPLEVIAQESVVTKVYTRRPKGSNTSIAPSSSSSVDLRLSKCFCGIWTPDAQST